MLPKASCSFNIPSVHDGLGLVCRLYYPRIRKRDPASPRLKAAIVAHPYAPLGGNYDDPIVATVGNALLKQGYILGTFNFRGARGSSGRTSWSAKPELGDYVSFYGFMMLFLNETVAVQRHSQEHHEAEGFVPLLILSGYSYGSMIASHLPATEVVRRTFAAPTAGSSEAEIRSRAQVLSREYVTTSRLLRQDSSVSRGRKGSQVPVSPSRSIAVGGSVSSGGTPSRELSSRRSTELEVVRHSLERVRRRLGLSRPSANFIVPASDDESTKELLDPQVCYLLISPILSSVAAFATLFSTPAFSRANAPKDDERPTLDGHRGQIISSPTCVVYGTTDMFTSQKKISRWVDKLKAIPGANFSYIEVAGAGHFWQGPGSEGHLADGVTAWSKKAEQF